MDYDNSNRIALWMNDKRQEQKHPHLKGSGETDQPVWASAWFSKDIDDGDKKALMGILKRYSSKKPFITISLQVKEQQGYESQPGERGFDDEDESTPF